MKFSDPATARTINRLRVLNLLRNEGAMSRADISRSLALNKPSTSEIVASLIAEGLAEEGGKVQTTSGRRPTAVSLKYDSLFVLGVELGSFTTSFLLSDLKGTILRYERLPTPPLPDAKEWGEKVIKSCMKFASTTTLAGIVVATAATLSDDRKIIIKHENWGWQEIPLAQAIEVHTKVPTILVHNVEAMVSAERAFAKEESETFLYI
ncbi:MAG: ROK family protein, partial [Sphaerochaeta sp.]|nr:ROK family protein [Sphaerochaeta sp.]